MTKVTSRASITRVIDSLIPLREVQGLPRSLACSKTHLYWMEGRNAKLHRVPLDGSAAPEPFDLTVPATTAPMSREEELLRERQRNTMKGVSSFRFVNRPDDESVELGCFFTVGLSLYFRDAAGTVRDLWRELTTAFPDRDLGGAKIDVKHSPVDPFTVSFVLDNNLHMATFPTTAGDGAVRHTTCTTTGTEDRTVGVADYILQEEFDQYTAQWWAPDGKALLFTVTDVSMLEKASMLDKEYKIQTMPFPKVGDPNARSSIVVRNVADGTFRILPEAALKQRFPWIEYVSRVAWRGDDAFYAVGVSRDQERMVHFEATVSQLPFIEEAAFFDPASALDAAAITLAAETIRVAFERYIPWAWAELICDFHVSTKGDYFVAHDVEDDDEHGVFSHLMHRAPEADVFKTITAGKWNIVRSSLQVKSDGRVFFRAGAHDPLVPTLCTMAGSEVVPLTPPGLNVHSYTVLPDTQGVAYVASTADSAPKLLFCAAAADGPVPPIAEHTYAFLPNAAAAPVVPTFDTYTNDRGVELPLAVFKPTTPRPAGGYPLMMYIYGGPHVQLVNKSRVFTCSPLIQALVAHGVAVAVVDNQCCHALGLRDLKVCKQAMGTFETDDYCAAVRRIISTSDDIDKDRVGIYGWSYGGYATLLAMAQAPDVFKIGCSGAPVGDWRLYDTGYTERYMGVLPQQDEAYNRGTIASVAAGFPDEPDRVFIAHGMTDENVHFSNTCHVLNAMVEFNKPYSLLVYPGERHGLNQSAKSRMHYDTSLIQTVLTRL